MNDTDKTSNDSATSVPPAGDPQAGSAADASGADAAKALPTAEDYARVCAERDAALADAASSKDTALRTLADLDTFRRRVQREKDDLRASTVGKVLEDLVPVYDTLSIALSSLKGSSDPAVIAKGVEMVQVQFRTAFERHGVAEVNPAPGAEFDPHRHESIAIQPHAEIAEGKVHSVFRVGFVAGTRVLRPASVVLSSGPAAPQA